MPASSSPIATFTPASAKQLSGATPERRRKLELQLWQMQVRVSATRAMSRSFSQTPWPSVMRSFISPKRSRYSTAVQPPRFCA